ncbi:MAG: glutamine-hydrolyzing carbamoyl-phosphate synthase small subunit [Nitrososphaerota archaeon]|nr:glutamine-hydrolyzing carbamoyl-phosphate synthase small subunit [Nitrososphaerota archaeon]MDG6979057.1 glutamine-hydrolyzing carbamoyl-phosphate synthase small subunit [Nitrososphaerota archaeon]MDG7022128.1 glutamine-hydrolyzing carbamoyl-phosphate synthase small subunit [Nitrososphaerota archaeon]
MEKPEGSRPAFLLLEDGTLLLGTGFGAEATVVGELVFNTGMVGYPESMTDPSYSGQVLCFTYPLIGNYGVPSMEEKDVFGLPRYFESASVKVTGIVVQEHCARPSHWASVQTLSRWMEDQGVPGIEGVDTRALVTTIRERGVMMCALATGREPPSRRELKRLLERSARYDSVDYVKQVSVSRPAAYGISDKKMVVVDCGVKESIIRNMLGRGYSVVRVPFDSPYAEIMKHDPAGVIVSNGPGDPRLCAETVKATSRLVDSGVPVLGICLGEQVLGMSQGGETYKLKYGHRGQNKPVVETTSGRGYVTSQNHGYAVDPESLSKTELKPWFVNGDDRSVEGLFHVSKPAIAVQFHPEAAPGPYDTEFVFDRFAEMMLAQKKSAAGERVRSMKA